MGHLGDGWDVANAALAAVASDGSKSVIAGSSSWSIARVLSRAKVGARPPPPPPPPPPPNARYRLCAQFGAVELFFDLVEGVVADLLRADASCSSASRAAPMARRRSGSAGSSLLARCRRSGSVSARSSTARYSSRRISASSDGSDSIALERGAIGDAAGLGGLARDRIVLLEFQREDQRPQRQALDHERPQHHRKGRQQDEIAIREISGQREGRRQRNDAAHAAPETR